MEYRQFNGRAALPFVEALGSLRMRVFREYPYLYDGDMSYERKYLESYFACPESLVVMALEGARIIGATTGMPLNDAEKEWQAPFEAQGIDKGSVFYFGESVLLPEYRGKGIGQRFFDLREAYAATLPQIACTSFCAVRRDASDGRRPEGYRPLDGFWSKRGYRKVAGLTTTFSWKEIGAAVMTPQLMEFWIREFR